MSIKRTLTKFSNLFQSALVVLIATFFVASIIYAATTIGSNITTGGNLSVTGTVTSTSVTSTNYLMVGVTAGSYTLFNHAGGDLYVTDDIEVDDDINVGGDSTLVGTLSVTGLATFDRVTSTSATSTAYLMVGVTAGSYTLFNHAGGDIYATDDIEVDDDANIAGSLTVGNVTTTDSLSIGGYASTTGDLIVYGGTIDMTTTTPTTTTGLFVRTSGTATSTVSIGDNEGDDVKGCIEMVRSNGTWARAIIDGTTWNIAAGRCND